MQPSARAPLPQRPVQRWRGNPVDTALLFHDGVMDDEDDRRLLDFIGDVQALNDYLHGSNGKSIEEDDLTNATFESGSSFFTNDTGGSDEGLKDGHNHLEEFGEVGASGLQLSSSLQFIEDELEGGLSPGEVDLGGEDQPFDILQKSLLEADITEQTLAQEALLDSQPTLAPATNTFPQQLVSGVPGGVSETGVVAPMPLAGAQPQAFIQQVPQLPLQNGPAGHIQFMGSLNGSSSSMMTFNSLERPQIFLRTGGNEVTGNTGQGTVFAAPTPGQISAPFNKGTIPLQNIIFQRAPVSQTLVRSIQPKALQTGGQNVYNISNLGIQPNTTMSNPVNNTFTANGSLQASQQVKVVSQATNIVVHSPLGQQGQPQTQSGLSKGQFIIPTGNTVHGIQAVNGQVLQTNTQGGDPSLASTTTYSILTNQNTAVQIIAGQNFAAGGQLIVNQGMVSAGQMGQASPTGVMQVAQRPDVTAKVWTASASPTPTVVQTLQAPNRLTMVNSTTQALPTHLQISVSPGQRLLVPVAQNNTSSQHIAVQNLQHQVLLTQKDSTLQKQTGQTQLVNLLGNQNVNSPANQESLKRPANQQLSKAGMFLEQLRRDHLGVMTPNHSPFTSLNDVAQRLLPYHVFQGTPPCEEDFAKVDEDFEAVATQVLQKTQSMVNKYRRLLMVEAERCNPSSEIVMIDRTFNQEERNNLTQDKRMLLVDPDSFLEEFCCGPKKKLLNTKGSTDSSHHKGIPSLLETSPRQNTTHTEGVEERTGGSIKPGYRTEAYTHEDPGGGGHKEAPIKISINIKKKRASNVISSSNGSQNHQHVHPAHHSTSPSHSLHSSEQLCPSGQVQSTAHSQVQSTAHSQVQSTAHSQVQSTAHSQVQSTAHSQVQSTAHSQVQSTAHSQVQSTAHSHVQISDTDSVLEAAVNSILDC
ncbi:BRD4-interacting chromatin-remodeling complex-associated protein-like [Trichomycterus rosablanca]|uniref:BRD4-interacting chromatin-remodeling complex-associated protein-like n=1 Tax=Trichomycterus rosablanca TaxID=2290929 RepID=UPI002F35BC21